MERRTPALIANGGLSVPPLHPGPSARWATGVVLVRGSARHTTLYQVPQSGTGMSAVMRRVTGRHDAAARPMSRHLEAERGKLR